ncbi:MAG: carboxypeptidase M32 [Armatimonadota bacterium]
METKIQELKARLLEVNDLESAGALLSWDQTTYMPPEGMEARGRQMATLGKLAHEKLTDPAIGRLLDALQPYAESLPYESDEAGLVRVTRRHYERAVKVPSTFVARLNQHLAETYDTWVKARPANDFSLVRPYLEKTVDLSREWANYFPGYAHIIDPLIDYVDYGVKSAEIRALFADLRKQLVPLVQQITTRPPIDDSCLRQHFPEARQLAFGREMVTRYGYDFSRGRQDKSPHPFMTKFSLGDVRITTRVKEDDLGDALFSTLHESGHAMYEQGIDRGFESTPLAEGASSGVHESQSRLWENLVGRSRSCWVYWYPRLQEVFPDQLGNVPLDTFYRAINTVERSLIRVDADEVTYNLHVMIRFDFEMALLEGTLAVSDLPEAWRARYTSDLGITPEDDRHGVLQDVHWFSGPVGGAFQCYTLGNILSAQFFDSAVRADPAIPGDIARGEYALLLGWLTEHIYRHGEKFTMRELVERATGGPLSIEPYISYLRTKYGELYNL